MDMQERVTMFDASGDSRIRVYRRDDKTMKYVMHGYLPPESSEEDVARQFGGGHYKCQLIVKDSQGASVIATSREFDLPGAYKPPMGELPGVSQRQPEAAPAADAIRAVAGPGGGNVMEILQSGLVGTVLDLLNKARQPVAADSGLTDVLREMARQASEDRRLLMETLKAMQGSGSTRAEVLAELQQMKALVAPSGAEAGRSQLEELVGAIKQLREVSEEFSPSDKAPTDPLAFVPQVLEVIAEEQKLRRGRQTPARPAAAPLPVTRGESVSDVKPQAEPTSVGVPVWQRVLEGEGPRLVQQAERGTDPEDVAALAIKFMPENLRGAFGEFFDAPTADVLALLVEHVPGLRSYPKWAEAFVVAAQYELFGEPDDPDQLPLEDVPRVH